MALAMGVEGMGANPLALIHAWLPGLNPLIQSPGSNTLGSAKQWEGPNLTRGLLNAVDPRVYFGTQCRYSMLVGEIPRGYLTGYCWLLYAVSIWYLSGYSMLVTLHAVDPKS